MGFKSLLIFTGGLGIGGLFGYFTANKILDKKYFEEYDKKVRELEEYYDRVGQYDRDHKDEDYEKKSESCENGREKGVLNKDQRSEIHKKSSNDDKNKTPYNKIYKKNESNEPDPAEKEHPEEDEDEENDEEEVSEEDESMITATYDHWRDRNKPPEIISPYDAGNTGPEWDHITFFYYLKEGILATEDNDIVENSGLFVGDCLDVLDEECGIVDVIELNYQRSGIRDATVFIKNYAHQTIYEVQCTDKLYEDSL